MKTSILAVLFGMASVSAWLPAGAQTGQQGETVTIPAPLLRIEAPTQRRFMDDAEFSAYKGGYDLSNGQILTLRRVGNLMYAEVGEQGYHRIVAVSHNTFVALDQKLKVRIDFDERGNAGGELWMVVPGSSVAGQPAEERLLHVALR